LNLAIITIHKGEYADLVKTVKSVDIQSKKPKKHLIIAKNLDITQIKKFKKKYRNFILNQDRSIYNAMNLGLKKTISNHVLFLNSGDCLISNKIISYILNSIKKEKKKCLIFKTALVYKEYYFRPKNNFFFSTNYLAHPSFIRPPINNNRIIKFKEKLKIISDGIWMKQNIDKFGYKKIDKIICQHIIGGVSTVPSLELICEKFSKSYFELLKEFIKLILYYFFKKNIYYKLIYKKNFDRT
jgi:hypothetical protein